jgi:hypothetical protein
VTYLLKARIVEPEKEPLLDNGCVTCNSGVIVGKGVFYAAGPIVTSFNNRKTLGSDICYAVRAEAI